MIHIARHAKSLAEGICYGRHDVACELDAEAACVRLREALAVVPTTLWSSPSARCREPAERLAQRLGVEHVIDARLYELDFGAWEGRSWVEIERQFAAELAAWMSDWKHVAPPGGETVTDLEIRVLDWVATETATGEHVVVGHAGVIRALSVLCEGVSWEAAMRTAVPHLAFRAFEARDVRRSNPARGRSVARTPQEP